MKKNKISGHVRNRVRESLFFLIIPVAAYVLLALFSYHPQDSGPFSASDTEIVRNYGGTSGAFLADTCLI